MIGINSVKYSDTSVEGIGYAIPMDTAKPIIEELITNEKVDESNSAYLGIVGVDVTSDVAKHIICQPVFMSHRSWKELPQSRLVSRKAILSQNLMEKMSLPWRSFLTICSIMQQL